MTAGGPADAVKLPHAGPCVCDSSSGGDRGPIMLSRSSAASSSSKPSAGGCCIQLQDGIQGLLIHESLPLLLGLNGRAILRDSVIRYVLLFSEVLGAKVVSATIRTAYVRTLNRLESVLVHKKSAGGLE